MVADARAGHNHYSLTANPVTGDDVAYDFPPRDGIAQHVGIFAIEADLRRLAPAALDQAITRFGRLGNREFWSVEGNTGVGSDNNGGAVMIRKRRKADVVAFMHPGSGGL